MNEQDTTILQQLQTIQDNMVTRDELQTQIEAAEKRMERYTDRQLEEERKVTDRKLEGFVTDIKAHFDTSTRDLRGLLTTNSQQMETALALMQTSQELVRTSQQRQERLESSFEESLREDRKRDDDDRDVAIRMDRFSRTLESLLAGQERLEQAYTDTKAAGDLYTAHMLDVAKRRKRVQDAWRGLVHLLKNKWVQGVLGTAGATIAGWLLKIDLGQILDSISLLF